MDPQTQSSANSPAQAPSVAEVSAAQGPNTTDPAISPVAAKPAVVNPPSQNSGKSSKMGVIIVVFITLILAVAGWYLYTNYAGNKNNSMSQEELVQPTPTVASPTVGPVKSGDSELDTQSDTIDNAIDKANSDVKDIDSSLNDQAENLN